MGPPAIIVHFGVHQWYVAVAAPDGHYEVVPMCFDGPAGAARWVEQLELEASVEP